MPFHRAGTLGLGEMRAQPGARRACWFARRAAGSSCLPLYLKSHSYGEYVFDWAWADAFEQAGGRYYQAAGGGAVHPGHRRRLLLREGAPVGTFAALAEVRCRSTRETRVSCCMSPSRRKEAAALAGGA
ncbi:MAG: peptidogalycan biosysnthesis protein [Rhodospirillales bacterium]